jgi:DNA-binding GntR family transcriptional regulator
VVSLLSQSHRQSSILVIQMAARHIEPADLTNTSPKGGAGRGLLKERAYAEIKRGILSGRLAPGSFLAERQLAAQLGMSKTPVRSALERLESEGFLSISPQQGAIIRDLSVPEIADQYEIRMAIEAFVVRTITGKLTPAQVGLVRANLAAQQANLAAGDVARGVALDEEFHGLFCEFLGNQEILRVMGQLRDKTHRVIFRVFTINGDRMLQSYEEHRAIAEAVLQGEAALAATRVEEHLRVGMKALLSRRP